MIRLHVTLKTKWRMYHEVLLLNKNRWSTDNDCMRRATLIHVLLKYLAFHFLFLYPRFWRRGHKNWSLRWGTGWSRLSEPHRYRTYSQRLVKQWPLRSVYATWKVTEGFICCSSSLRSGLWVHLAWISHLPTLMSTKFWQGDKWANASLCDRRAYCLNHNIHDFWGSTVTTNWVLHTCLI